MPTDLDQGGAYTQYVRTYLGPSVGWVMLPVVPETFVTAGPTYTVQPFDSRVMLNSVATPVTAVQLPDVSVWLKASYQQPKAPFDGSLWIKDFAYKATASNIVVSAFGTQKIDGLASFQIIQDGSLIRCYPLTDLSGWFVG